MKLRRTVATVVALGVMFACAPAAGQSAPLAEERTEGVRAWMQAHPPPAWLQERRTVARWHAVLSVGAGYALVVPPDVLGQHASNLTSWVGLLHGPSAQLEFGAQRGGLRLSAMVSGAYTLPSSETVPRGVVPALAFASAEARFHYAFMLGGSARLGFALGGGATALRTEAAVGADQRARALNPALGATAHAGLVAAQRLHGRFWLEERVEARALLGVGALRTVPFVASVSVTLVVVL